VRVDFPKLDVLMNNAGIMLYKNLKAPAADLTGLMTEMDINVGGVIRVTSAFIDLLTANKGTVILIAEFTNSADSSTSVEKFAVADRKDGTDIDWQKIEGTVTVPPSSSAPLRMV